MIQNCLTDFPYRTRYYLTHPRYFFKHCGQNLRNAWQRITRGYCDEDLWNVDDYLLPLMEAMVTTCIAEQKEVFEHTDEYWQNWEQTRQDLQWINEHKYDYELADEQNERTKRVFNFLGENIYSLWL